MGSPVFGPGDRVASQRADDGLPAELVGKSPGEIARYYQQRETTLRAELEARPPATPTRVTPPVVPPPSKEEFWNDPLKTTDARIGEVAITKTEFEQRTAGARESLKWTARQMLKEKHPDCVRIETQINEVLKLLPEWQHADYNMLETVYFQVRGREHDRLSAEDRVKPNISSEPVNPGTTPVTTPTDLTRIPGPPDAPHKTAAFVADHLGMSHETYLSGKTKYEHDGMLPLTVDTRRGTPRKAGQ